MNNRSMSNFMNIAGFASIIVSIIIWVARGAQAGSNDEKAHGERLGIFVGLWAPTFFVLANRLELAAQDTES